MSKIEGRLISFFALLYLKARGTSTTTYSRWPHVWSGWMTRASHGHGKAATPRSCSVLQPSPQNQSSLLTATITNKTNHGKCATPAHSEVFPQNCSHTHSSYQIQKRLRASKRLAASFTMGFTCTSNSRKSEAKGNSLHQELRKQTVSYTLHATPYKCNKNRAFIGCLSSSGFYSLCNF